jgi:hypothetical protein
MYYKTALILQGQQEGASNTGVPEAHYIARVQIEVLTKLKVFPSGRCYSVCRISVVVGDLLVE